MDKEVILINSLIFKIMKILSEFIINQFYLTKLYLTIYNIF